MKQALLNALLIFTVSLCANAQAQPLASCPSEAFLVQGSPAQLFGVDLATGSYRSLQKDTGAASVLNAFAFNFHDQYLYAWDKAQQTPVRIGASFEIEALTLKTPLNGHYYVGDISLSENSYYVYRKGSDELHGLWRISLDADNPEYLNPVRVVDGRTVYLNIYDFAFHPYDDQLYSVASNGNLYSIDPKNGAVTLLGNVGERGTFGAVYFDIDANFYVSRNKDGRIYKIDLTQSDPQAVYFAQGPSSSSNDGARCAIAPVIPVDSVSIDFGDAPDTYGTSLAENGARHEIASKELYLGSLIDGEAQAYLAPDSDDAFGQKDEDGVVFVTALGAGAKAIVQLTTSSDGYLNGWVDFDQNGTFDESDRLFEDEFVSAGTFSKVIEVPLRAKGGMTWSRFRVSSVTGAQATGGMPDGEVEDYQVTVSPADITQMYYPSQDSFVTIAFEDLWPSVGDYDLNDFVVNYRTGLSFVDGRVVSVHISGQILAMGATFHNGFAVEIAGLPRELIDLDNVEYEINRQVQSANPLEEGHSDAVFVVAEDLWDYVTPAEGCSFYRTESNCGESPIQFGFRIDAPLTSSLDARALELGLFNPFLFATPGYNRNSIFPSPPGRDLEIHLKNMAPSELADQALLGRADDRSDMPLDLYYQTEKGMPWAIEIGNEWVHPGEYIDLVDAYPGFVDFVQSGGLNSQDWYLLENAVLSNLYQD